MVLSVVDVTSKINACGDVMCFDRGVAEGMTIDLDAGPRLNYGIVANGQRIQHSGTAMPASLTLTADTPQRVAGVLTIDDRGAGGPQLQVECDAALVEEFTKAH